MSKTPRQATIVARQNVALARSLTFFLTPDQRRGCYLPTFVKEYAQESDLPHSKMLRKGSEGIPLPNPNHRLRPNPSHNLLKIRAL